MQLNGCTHGLGHANIGARVEDLNPWRRFRIYGSPLPICSRDRLHVRAMCRVTSDHGYATWRSGFSPDAIRNSITVRLV